MMSVALLAEEGHRSPAYAGAAASLCLGCGACGDHCKLHVPVADHLRAVRLVAQGAPPVETLRPIEGSANVVAVLAADRDWSGRWTARTGEALARLHTADSLGHAAWKAGVPGVIEAVAAHFTGREILTASGATAAVARAAGVPVRRLEAGHAGRPFVTCHEVRPRDPTQLACCGRREGFEAREPEAARAVAVENARRFGGEAMVCADEECACFLRSAGAIVYDPFDGFEEEFSDGQQRQPAG
jgi:ferredoxin